MARDELQPGDQVEWNTPQGKTTGRVVKKLTSETDVQGHHVAASEENPEFSVESDKSGAQAAHRPGALKKVQSGG